MMLVAALVILLLMALVFVTTFHFSILWVLLLLASSVAGLVLKATVIRKLPKWLERVVLLILCGIGMLSLVCMKSNAGESKLTDYKYQVVKIEEMLIDGETRSAEKEIADLEKIYGSDDTTEGLYAYLAVKEGDLSKAYARMDGYQNKKSHEYYMRMEYIYHADDSLDRDALTWRLRNLYNESAEQWPDWFYAQQQCGILLFEQKEYSRADYYLSRANALQEGDPMVLYYLGATACEMGRMEKGIDYFTEAVENGASEEIMGAIAYYVKRMETQE